jgi:hypothetical protein
MTNASATAVTQSASRIQRLGRSPGWGLVFVCLISIVVSGRQMLWYFSHGPAVTDLRIFMTGIDMVKSGEGQRLYRFDAQEKVQTQLYPETQTSGLLPFNHPAYELLFYWPLSGLSYRRALVVWAVAKIGLLFLIAYHLDMQDLRIAMLPMVVLCERVLLMYGAAGVGTLNARVAVLAVAIAALYLYRIAGEGVLIVLMRGCLLAVPIFVLWLVALRRWGTAQPHDARVARIHF